MSGRVPEFLVPSLIELHEVRQQCERAWRAAAEVFNVDATRAAFLELEASVHAEESIRRKALREMLRGGVSPKLALRLTFGEE
jgi:hypothetical protein